MLQQRKRRSVLRLRIQQCLTGAAMLLVVGIGSDLQAQMQCSGGDRAGGGQMAGRGGGGPMGGRGGGPGAAMGGGSSQMGQMMQMMMQAQQLQQMQQQYQMMQQTRLQQNRFQQDLLTRQQLDSASNRKSAIIPTFQSGSQSASPTKPTMTRRERLQALIQQRREEQTQKKLSRRELAIQRSGRNQSSTIIASLNSSVTGIAN
ncbi:MAG: hypothetical protein HQ518_14565 [Rhodopirellula sp.]|nr:hypothetical protein [Rhodopirellula sp.]